MHENLHGRVAVVTGAARGIGAAIVQRLAADGADVAILDLDVSDCGPAIDAVEARGRRGVAIAANVTDEASVAAAFEDVEARLGKATILVNNAGIIRDNVFAKMTLDDWDSVIGVHLRGAFLAAKAAVPSMRDEGWGRIVNLSSIAALGNFGQANYSTAKAGLQGLTKTLSMELGKYGITANAVAPGFTVTAMTEAVAARTGIDFAAMQEEAAKSIPVRRVGTPKDVANAVAFFCDPRAGYVSGQVLYVGGGPFA